jgi:hypothetical protein
VVNLSYRPGITLFEAVFLQVFDILELALTDGVEIDPIGVLRVGILQAS